MKNMISISMFLALMIIFTVATFSYALGGTINGYSDQRQNTANNFDAPQGYGFAEYQGEIL